VRYKAYGRMFGLLGHLFCGYVGGYSRATLLVDLHFTLVIVMRLALDSSLFCVYLDGYSWRLRVFS
jgi:hypothetical protein